MSLLRAEQADKAVALILKRGERLGDALRIAEWGKDGDQVPNGMARLEGDDAKLFADFMLRQAHKEKQGVAVGDIATTATENPAVAEEFAALESQVSDA